jgi:hypothetical protein
MTYFIFLKSLRSLEEFRKNPHVKIPPKSPPTNFQSLGIFKNQILFGKQFFLHFRPIRPFSPAVAHFIFFSTSHFSPPPSPPGLGLSAGPSRPLGPVDRTSVAPCRIAASHTGKRLTSRRLRPSLCLADMWAPPIITFLRRRLSSTPRRRLIEPPRLLCPPLCHPLFMVDRYHSLISAIITITTPNSSSPF